MKIPFNLFTIDLTFDCSPFLGRLRGVGLTSGLGDAAGDGEGPTSGEILVDVLDSSLGEGLGPAVVIA